VSAELVDHWFRHEHGRLVAVLVGRVGLEHVEAVEDAVQGAMMAALGAWAAKGVPDEPGAWLYRVARNELLDALRTERRRRRILDEAPPEEALDDPAPATFEDEVRDELLRMLFICCDERIPEASRLVLALKTLCGFSTSEIAARLFTRDANVYKRLARARARLAELAVDLSTPPLDALRSRLPSVHAVIYLLFNEGWLSVHAEHAIRVELCEEALRLGGLLAAHRVGASPETAALMALMHLHAARLASRTDATGGLLLLEEQDRSRWDARHLREGARWLERSARGDAVTRFHAEAGIAAEHAFAPSFEATDWGAIARLYALLERLAPSPLHRLNRAVAIAQRDGPSAGLGLLDGRPPPAWLDGHHLYEAVLADLHRRAGHEAPAAAHRERALAAAPSDAVRALLRRRLG